MYRVSTVRCNNTRYIKQQKRLEVKMKNIAVMAADGRVARKVIIEAVNRKMDVTAFGCKDENITDAQHYIKRRISSISQKKT